MAIFVLIIKFSCSLWLNSHINLLRYVKTPPCTPWFLIFFFSTKTSSCCLKGCFQKGCVFRRPMGIWILQHNSSASGSTELGILFSFRLTKNFAWHQHLFVCFINRKSSQSYKYGVSSTNWKLYFRIKKIIRDLFINLYVCMCPCSMYPPISLYVYKLTFFPCQAYSWLEYLTIGEFGVELWWCSQGFWKRQLGM